MKKHILFFLLTLLTLIIPFTSLGAEGDCYYFTQINADLVRVDEYTGVNECAYPMPYFDETTEQFKLPPCEQQTVTDTFYRPMLYTIALYAYKWNETTLTWNKVHTFGLYAGTPLTFDPSSLASWPNDADPFPDGCPADCADEYQAKIEECGGEQYIVNWVQETCTGDCDTCERAHDDLIEQCGAAGVREWDPINCYGSCNCNPDDIANADQTCADHGGLAYYDNELCLAVCQDCAYSEPSCEYGVKEYNYDTCDYTCNSCLTIGNDCPFECTFTCFGDGAGSLVSNCECTDDPVDDPTDPPDNPDDNTDDTDPGDPGDQAPNDDGTNDNELLGSIARNAEIIADNTQKIHETNQKELNKLNANADDIEDEIGVSNQYLDAIKENTFQGVNAQKEGNEYLEQIEQNTSDSAGHLASIRQTFDDFWTFIQGIFMDEGEEQPYIADAESDIDSAWTTGVSDMQSAVTGELQNLDPVTTTDAGPIKSFLVDLIPSNQTCQDLDFSFRDHEIIVSCEHTAELKVLLAYFVYVSTIIIIFTMVHHELRPNK